MTQTHIEHQVIGPYTVLFITCPLCGAQSTLMVDTNAFVAWDSGMMLIQDAFYDLSSSEREQILSGICNPCWEREYGEDQFPPIEK